MKNVIFFIYLEMQEFVLLYPKAIAKYEFDNISNTHTIEILTSLYNNDKVINWIHTFFMKDVLNIFHLKIYLLYLLMQKLD